MTLFDDDKANNYKANMATFSPTDDLVLNDGVLWDVRSRKPLHKFDKFNQFISGVFHPQGQEIIINSEVVSFVRSTPGRLPLWVFFLVFFLLLLIPLGKFGIPYLGKATTGARAALQSHTSACWIFFVFL